MGPQQRQRPAPPISTGRSGTARPLPGRRDVLDALEQHVQAGHIVLLYGPRGAGKSAVLHALAKRCVASGAAVGAVERTETLADLTLALARAYPGVESIDGASRRTRARLRLAAEERPCILLLDHLGHVGTGFKSLLRSLRGTGSGVVLAGDADHARDHQQLRGLRLTHRELELPRLPGRSMYALFRRLLARSAPRYPLHPEDLHHLARLADGRPGRAVWLVDELAKGSAWRNGRVRVEWLRMEGFARGAAGLAP